MPKFKKTTKKKVVTKKAVKRKTTKKEVKRSIQQRGLTTIERRNLEESYYKFLNKIDTLSKKNLEVKFKYELKKYYKKMYLNTPSKQIRLF